MELSYVDGVALLRMRAGKANAIGPAFLDALEGRLAELRASDAPAAVVTGDGRFFSAGLALPELVRLDRAAMRAFIERFDRAMEGLFELPMPLVAAIDGHAIAGGCVLALQCDRRLAAAGGARIGLTEATLGIGLPPSVAEALRATLPARSLCAVALEGRLFGPEEAASIGLVDEVVPAAALEARALALARALGANGRDAYAQIKSALRAPYVERMRASRDRELERWIDTWFSPLARTRLEAVVAKLAR